ncbi:MAG: His/Gly/Thr/Pro-type tRNA ligase C-terminal domain-containing protein, partial [Terriglobales bacterium]
RLVRGLDYYTRTTFEFTVPSSADPASGLGTQNALLGGGRYDGLAQELGAPAQAGGAIGFALGEDRLVMAMQAARTGAHEAGPRAVIVPLGAEQRDAGLRLAQALRREGLRVEMTEAGRKLGKALEQAARLAPYALLLGPEEVAAEAVQVKDLRSGEQTRVTAAAVGARLR